MDSIQNLITNKKLKLQNINPEVLRKHGLISSLNYPVKILGNGEVKSKLNVEANQFSKSAAAKIEAAGGSVKKI